ncbi:Tetraspanin-1 [Orchesella cincta]|uniref:Tetraspanin-1 n=1 Tax=Orchesella cincta TaxID=48709 RepID=A0A1D2M725_ORCCI|nr:Tetraspanin-1 [Orchesella cincta]
MMENFIICTAIIGPFILGIFLVWGAFAVKNGIIWYFGRILDYEGFELANLTIPCILLIVADGMAENIMLNSMGNYYNDGSPSQNVSVQFWDYLQENLKCCGIHGYTDWVAASQAPEIGFIPTSCCMDNAQSSDNVSCTEAITKDKISAVAFITNTIYMDGCLFQYNSSYGIGFLELTAIIAIFCHVCGLITACVCFHQQSVWLQQLDIKFIYYIRFTIVKVFIPFCKHT